MKKIAFVFVYDLEVYPSMKHPSNEVLPLS